MAQRPDYERWLESHDLVWKYQEDLPLSSINEERSRTNQVRLMEGAVADERVAVYAQAMEEGAEFPPILVRPFGTQYVIIDGNHRFFATKKNGRPVIEAYIVSPSPEKLETLNAEVNSRNGYALTDEERVAHVIHLVKIGMDMRAAAKAVGITHGRASVAWAIDRAERRARDLRVKHWDKIGTWARMRLGNISTDTAFIAGARAVHQYRPNQAEINKFVTAINRCRSEADQVAFIEKTAEEWASKGKSNGLTSSRNNLSDKARLLGVLSTLAKVDVYDINASALVDERPKLVEGCRTAARVLLDYAERIESGTAAHARSS